MDMEFVQSVMEQMQYAAQIEKGRVLHLYFADLDLMDGVNELIRMNKSRGRDLQFQVRSHSVPKYVSADPCIFKHVLQPLLNFVIAYAPEGSKVDVCVFQAVNYFTFKIDFSIRPEVDLNVELITKCFHQYYTSSEIDQGFRARSLGLFIASNLIQMMGGSLEYYNESNEALFQFNLSLKASHKAPSVFISRPEMKWDSMDFADEVPETSTPVETAFAEEHAHHHKGVVFSSDMLHEAREISKSHDFLGLSYGRQLRILVVDDSDLCKRMLRKALETFGYATDSANNGKEALKLLAITPCVFDAVIMDVVMPIMNGIEATKEIRQTLKLTGIPIIILTANVSDETRNEAMAAGATEFILKPVYSTVIINSLASHGVTAKVPGCA